MQIQFKAAEFETPSTAVAAVGVHSDVAISIENRSYVVNETEYRRIQALGVQPTTWRLHEPTGRIMSVPGN
jgi:hypothetical protein